MTSSTLLAGLPEPVLQMVKSSIFTEFATLSAQGVPIDTPTFSFLDSERGSLDIATGLAYPAKAERARRNPKVGLLLEGMPDEPVVSIAGLAAVRDADIQANVDRYIAETIAYYAAYSSGNPWSVARKSVWYWTRIFVCCTPKRILWWPSAAQMDAAPQRWDAPATTVYPRSDPAPTTKGSAAPTWPIRPWEERAREVLGHGLHAHLTLLDDEGFPMPIRARSVRQTDEGFELDVPAGVPWKLRGKGSLCFVGVATFIGEVRMSSAGALFAVERVLPTLPTVADPRELWAPSETTRSALMGRLEAELQRRGLSVPTIPPEPPAPTAGSVLRAERIARVAAESALKHGSEQG
jgi:hypothetical protein